MLFTRCPECDTTFRVTNETLKKANGQVRCGRCANVFNGYAELHDPPTGSIDPQPPTTTDLLAELERERKSPASPAEGGSTTATVDVAPPIRTEEDAEHDAAQVPATVATAIAETEASSAEGAAEPVAGASQGDARPITASEVERVLAVDAKATLSQGAFPWSPSSASAERPRSSRWWGPVAVLALLVLSAQAVHHFRSDLVNDPLFGAWVRTAYERMGIEIAPKWDVRQYQILDWVATAEPNSRGLGSLKITARIQNQGPLQQPYPAVRLRLKDRWETAVGSRLFSPAEYLPRETPRGRLMSANETARAEIEVVDPGPDAYGFELDVCIEVEPSLVSCGTDEIFL